MLAVIITCISNMDAKSYNLGDDFYGKVYIGAGYAFQQSRTDGIKVIEPRPNQNFRVAIVNVGNNFYYRFSDVFNPFVGLDVEGRIPLKTNVIDHFWTGADAKDFWRINDFLSTHLKIGIKMNIFNELALSTYGLIGFTLVQSASKGYVGINNHGVFTGHSPVPTADADRKYNLSKTYIGLSTGFGISTTFNISEGFAVFGAVEYQFHMVKSKIASYHHLVYYEFVGGDNADGWVGHSRISDYKLHQISVKLGFEFL